MTKIGKKDPAAAWLWAAVVSMMFMGIYAFLIALSRAPGFNTLFTDPAFFKTALVTHVVLSVVIWFLAFILFVAYFATSESEPGPLDYLPVAGAFIGIALIVITPFTGHAEPVLNNYIPTLKKATYFAGVSIFLLCATLGAGLRAPALARGIAGKGPYPAIVTGSLAGAGISLGLGVVILLYSWRSLTGMDGIADTTVFYEALFWGGGHVLQFSNTMGLMAVWTLLALRVTGGDKLMNDKLALAVLGVMTLFAIAGLIQSFRLPAFSVESRQFFTSLKGWGVALGPIAVGAAAVLKIRGENGDPVARRGLVVSMALFALGGAIALTLHGSDTRVPAHYHGVIGAVTLAFMAFALVVTRDNGWLTVSEKWMKRQLTIYGAGQTLFVMGLYIGGRGGLARKTFGVEQKLDSALKYTGMTVMGIGGLLAVTGGVIFIVFMLKSFFGKTKS